MLKSSRIDKTSPYLSFIDLFLVPLQLQNKSKPLELLASKEEEFYQLARRKEYFKHLKEDYFKPALILGKLGPKPF